MATRRRSGTAWPRGWRGLGLFWALVLGLLGVGAATLQWLGPPAAHSRVAQAPKRGAPEHGAPEYGTAPEPGAALAPRRDVAEAASRPAMIRPASAQPGSARMGPILPPDPALLQPGRNPDAGMLPRIGPDGRTPGQVYARGFVPEPDRPRIGIVLAGVGMNTAYSNQAITTLPGELTLALSPYAPPNPELLELARRNGHEMLQAVPMEPTGFPLHDPGEHALLTGAAPEQNRRALEWALSRFAGYAGVTAALGGRLNGERFPAMTEQMDPILSSLAARGLFYVDPRVAPGPEAAGPSESLPYVWNRSVDVVLDDPGDATAIEANLVALEAIARDKGSALGLLETLTPVALERLAAWSNTIAGRGFALAPASALMRPPGKAGE